MYVWVLKNRMYETKLLKEESKIFTNDFCPLIEVINLKIGRTEKTVDEVLEFYDNNIMSNYFIDFFQFGKNEYVKYDYSSVTFSENIESYNYLDDLLLKVTTTKRGIPVISIKKAREWILNDSTISKIIIKLQEHNNKIAVRIEALLFVDFFPILNKTLRPEDYLFYDINEGNIIANVLDIDDIKATDFKYQMLVLHSPRKKMINNGEYEICGFTKLIDNNLSKNYKNYGFTGVADYAGLKNNLPSSGGSGFGAALGMFYVGSKNKFFTIMNPDTKRGGRGYDLVLPEFFQKEHLLNPDNNCLAFEFMKKTLLDRAKNGTFAQWNYITILRYLSEMKKIYK